MNKLLSSILCGASVALVPASALGAFDNSGNPAGEKIPAAVPADSAPKSEKDKGVRVPVDFCEVSAPIKIAVPAFSEEKNLQDKTFDDEARLRTEIPDAKLLKFAAAVKSADAGKFSASEMPVLAMGAELRVFRFCVETQAFAKLKIYAKTPQLCEIYADGKKIGEKLTTEAEGADAGTASGEVSLPNQRYEILVKTLVATPGKNDEIELWVTTEKPLDKAQISFPKPESKRRITLADVNEGERVSSSAISPNGDYVMNKFSEMTADGKTRSRTEVREVASGKIVFRADGTERGWMPKGARIWERRVADGKAAYVAWDLKSGAVETLVENLTAEDSSEIWLPDESGLIVVKTEKWKNETDEYKRHINIEDRIPKYRDRKFLYLYRFADGAMIRLTAGSASAEFNAVSRDSKKILFSVSKVDYERPEYTRNSLYMMNLENFECETLVADDSYDFSASFSPDGNSVLLTAGPNAFGGIGKNLPEGMPANSFDTQAFIMDLATKKIRPITREFNPSVLAAQWAGDGNIYITAEDKDFRRVFRYSPATETFEAIAVPEEVVSSFSVSNSIDEFKPVAAAVGQSAIVPPKAYLIDLQKNEAREYLASLTELIAEVDIPDPQDWNFISADGTEITGQFFLPPNFDPKKKYPMIVYYYGGTSPVSRAFSSHYSFPLWSSKGYVVYVLQPSGATGFGQEFSARHLNAWGKRTADDIIEGVKKFCAEHDFVNPKKIGCIGASYGGFMTMYLQTRTDIFAAAVAHAGISDVTSYWGEGYWGTSYNAIAAAGSFPWKDKDVFVEQSPLFSADKIKTPILLCHGQVDTNVPTGESIQLFAALKLLGKPVELVTFKSEDHFILDYTRRKQWIQSHLAWFDRWLKDDPDWWNELYPDSQKNW